MATKTDVLTLITMLTANVALTDTTDFDRLYDEVIVELASDPRLWFTAASILDTGTVTNLGLGGGANNTKEQEYQELPQAFNIGRVLAIMFNGRQLSRETEMTLKAIDRAWEDRVGPPVAFTTDQRSDRFVRLYPRNDVALTEDTDRAVVVLHTLSAKTTGVPTVLVLPLALLVIAREYERESAHRDSDFAQACRALGSNMLTYVD